MKRFNAGFTLIELVVVITILGILAAFAVPKFIALDSQARVATINGLAGSVKSAASLARGLAMATGVNGATGTVAMEGATGAGVTLAFNYPDGTAAGIANAVNTSASDFTFVAAAGGNPATWTKVGSPGTCQVAYTAATALGTTPTIVTTTTGC